MLPATVAPRQEAALTPADAVRLALLQNPKLKAARAEREAALAQNDRERPVARPSVTVEAVGQFQGPRVTFPRAGGGAETVVPERYGRFEVTVEQVLYRAGLGAARARFTAQGRSANLAIRRAEEFTAIEALRAFHAAESAAAQAGVAREGVEMARRQLDLTRTMLEAGTASERDVRASEADLAEAELGRSRAESGDALARANLNRVMGREASLPLTLKPAEPLPVFEESLPSAQETAVRARPEILLLDESLVAAKAGVSLAGTQNAPTISARAIGAAQTETALTDSSYFAAGLTLKWSPFDQGKTRADVREARARVAQLNALKEDAVQGIRLEVEKAWRDAKTARERIEVASRQVTAAEAALEVSRVRYEVGSATQIEVSGSLFGVLRARSNRAAAEAEARLAYAELQYAKGSAAPLEGRPQPREPRR